MLKWKSCPAQISQRDALRNAIRGACMGSQQQWPAALAYLRTAYEAGCRDPICLRWLSIGLMSTGETQAAEAALGQWQQVSPDNPEPARLLASLTAKSPVRIDMPNAGGTLAPVFPHLSTPLSTPSGGMLIR